MDKVYTSYIVTDGEREGEVFAYAISPYDDVTPAAYVVFRDGSADWLPVLSLTRVNATATAAVAEVAA